MDTDYRKQLEDLTEIQTRLFNRDPGPATEADRVEILQEIQAVHAARKARGGS